MHPQQAVYAQQPVPHQHQVPHHRPGMFQQAPVYPGQPAGQIIVEQQQRKGMSEDEAVCCVSYGPASVVSWTLLFCSL